MSDDKETRPDLLGRFLDQSVDVARTTRSRKLRSLMRPLAAAAGVLTLARTAYPDCNSNTCATANSCDDNTCWQTNTCTSGNTCVISNTCVTSNTCVATNTTQCAPSGNTCQKSNTCKTNTCNFNSCQVTDTCSKNTCHANGCTTTNTCTSDDWCTVNSCLKSDTDCGFWDVSHLPMANVKCACGG